MNNNYTYILVSSSVPDSLFSGKKTRTRLERYTEEFVPDDSRVLTGGILHPDDWPLPKTLAKKFSAESVLIWNPQGKTYNSKTNKKLILGEIRGLSGQDEIILKLFIKNLTQKNLLQYGKKILSREQEINRELLKVGVALSAERDNNKLLNLILQQIRQLTRSDAGSLYLLEEDEETGEHYLLFKISHNDSNPTDFSEFRMPLNTSSIAGYVAETGEVLNIPDVYELDKKGKITFNKSYDETTGYRTKSSLTVPMADHKGNVIGVLQLLNKKREWDATLKTPGDVEAQVIEFDLQNESIILSLASQAAVSLENNRLYTEIQTLFEGFVRASVKAIESRDPTTSGHSHRVATLTIELAEAISRETEGAFREVSFSQEELLELRYACLLHDFGKVGVREAVLVKAKKLYPGQIDLIKSRLNQISAMKQREELIGQIDTVLKDSPVEYKSLYTAFQEREQVIEDELSSLIKQIEKANEPQFLEGEAVNLLESLGKSAYIDHNGFEIPYLTDDEYALLGITRGSLNSDERREIESHVDHSYNFLSQIPWSRDMKNVPVISKAHHEVLDGSGYPEGLKGREIMVQSQLMTIADIFDALTASDRPYKKAMSRDKALSILYEEADAGKINPELVRIFEKNKLQELKF